MSPLKAFLRRNRESSAKSGGPSNDERKADVDLQEELDELTSSEKPRNVDRAKTEAERTISDATVADIRGITLMERGRCPECGGRAELMVFSRVCTSCGWYRWGPQKAGQCTVIMDTGEKIRCDKIYNVKGDRVLCVRDDVVRNIVASSAIRRVNYEWDEESLARERIRFQKERTGVCDWCGAGLKELPEDATPLEDYAAFGAFQEKFRFCSEKCLAAFRRQYPTRIHRNCYQTDCNTCYRCIKRFDTTSFKRIVTPPS